MAKSAASNRPRTRSKDVSPARPSAPPLPPLKPRPRLTLILGLILIAWITLLIALWYLTVRPYSYYKVHTDVGVEPQTLR